MTELTDGVGSVARALQMEDAVSQSLWGEPIQVREFGSLGVLGLGFRAW